MSLLLDTHALLWWLALTLVTSDERIAMYDVSRLDAGA